jgi:catechol 2,3-dioxygenase-like lactoylglutathione lyase family enzyme
MLGHMDAVATIAVKNIEVADKFYQGKLGLTAARSQEPGVREYRSGNAGVLVYESRYAGTNQATAATWLIPEGLEALVSALKAKGIAFEHYDLPGVQRQGDVHLTGSSKAAWFKDPDGNILALVGQ